MTPVVDIRSIHVSLPFRLRAELNHLTAQRFPRPSYYFDQSGRLYLGAIACSQGIRERRSGWRSVFLFLFNIYYTT
jgi:hypothetical protein